MRTSGSSQISSPTISPKKEWIILKKLRSLFRNPRLPLTYVLLNIWYMLKLYLPSSQFGEDLILNYLIRKDKWLYIDIWANEPYWWSNTYLFYKKWWDGITIEPNKHLYHIIQKHRPKAINLNLAVWQEWSLTYYEMDAHGLSTCDPSKIEFYESLWHKLVNTYETPVRTLSSIFDEHLHGRTIDVLSIDVEWMEMSVLESNNREKYKPHYIVLETVIYQGADTPGLKNDRLYTQYLSNYGYKVIADTYVNTIYQLSSS